MKKYNIIILIIASDEPVHYIEMQKIWAKYMNLHSEIKSFFIKGRMKDQVDEIVCDEEHNTLYANIEDSLIPGILEKTLKCIDFILKNYEFKYIYRTNLSSFLNLNLMNIYAVNNDFNYGAVIGNFGEIKFGSGCGFFLSKEICKILLENNSSVDYKNYYDDVFIGKTLTKYCKIKPIPRLDIVVAENEISKIHNSKSDIFHYRCKNHWENTIKNLEFLYNLIYLK